MDLHWIYPFIVENGPVLYIVDVPIKSRDVRFLVCLPEGMPEIMRTMGTYANHPLFSIHVFF